MHSTLEAQIIECVDRLDAILATPIFSLAERRNVFVRSAFTETIILLRDLLHKSEDFGHRISFTDDVILVPGVKDVSDAVRHVRDAACHLDSQKRVHPDGATFAFCVAYGFGSHFSTSSGPIPTDYDDDVAFIYGPHRLYLRRHIIRAYLEARSHLRTLSEMVDVVCSMNDDLSKNP